MASRVRYSRARRAGELPGELRGWARADIGRRGPALLKPWELLRQATSVAPGAACGPVRSRVRHGFRDRSQGLE